MRLAMCIHKCVGTRVDMCKGMRIADMCAGVGIDKREDLYADMRIGICVDMRIDTYMQSSVPCASIRASTLV